MLSLIDPSADVVWESVGTTVSAGGIVETAPRTDEDWANVFEWMDRLPFFEETWGEYLGPGLNVVHLLAMVVFAGALLIVDRRLLGGVLKRHPVAPIARDAPPWLIRGFLALVVTGIPATIATALGQYYNPVFRFKMWGWCRSRSGARWQPAHG